MEEINRVKDELREYTDRVNKGETTFSTLARLYSEDPGSARMGGEMDYVGRGMLDPAFANVAFNLTDPKKISKIVESEFGYHIIQLIDKRGDKSRFAISFASLLFHRSPSIRRYCVSTLSPTISAVESSLLSRLCLYCLTTRTPRTTVV